MFRSNPNATAAGGTFGVGVLVVYVMGLFGLDVPAEVAVAGVGVVTTAVLAVGRHGIRGLARRLWAGDGSV